MQLGGVISLTYHYICNSDDGIARYNNKCEQQNIDSTMNVPKRHNSPPTDHEARRTELTDSFVRRASCIYVGVRRYGVKGVTGSDEPRSYRKQSLLANTSDSEDFMQANMQAAHLALTPLTPITP